MEREEEKKQRMWVALFRGINVGGHHKLPMKALSSDLEALGCSGVQTYIQSGNVVFRAAGSAENLSTAIAAQIEARHGFSPWVLVAAQRDFAAWVHANPFPDAEAAPQTLHCYFLAKKPAKINASALDAIKRPNESYALAGRVFFLHAPDGIGRSKLAQRVERILCVEATARNWRTVEAILAACGDQGV